MHAAWVSGVPVPTGIIRSDLWNQASELTVTVHRGAGKAAESRQVSLKAIHDGRAISIMARWADESETFVRRAWVWNAQKKDYDLETYEVDQCALLWPLSPAVSFCMLDGRDASYDVWQWRAGWSDISGYAEDRRVVIRAYPKDAVPPEAVGPLYPSQDGDERVEILWAEDEGIGGTRPTSKPEEKTRLRMPGGEKDEARGSAADIRVGSHYQPRLHKGENKIWQIGEKGNEWTVQFYRLLVASSPQEDYAIRGRGPHPFAVAIWDNENAGNHFTSGPIQLLLEREPKAPD